MQSLAPSSQVIAFNSPAAQGLPISCANISERLIKSNLAALPSAGMRPAVDMAQRIAPHACRSAASWKMHRASGKARNIWKGGNQKGSARLDTMIRSRRHISRILQLRPSHGCALLPKNVTFVGSREGVVSLLARISSTPIMKHPALYVDIEGAPLSRCGRISILTIYAHSKRHAYLVDVHTLQSAAFDTAAPDGTTLRSILQSPAITKVFFDLRTDAHVLHAHFNIGLRGIQDVQVMENAVRTDGHRRFLHSLGRCIEQDAHLEPYMMRAWREVKKRGLRITNPDRGGSHNAFLQRPLDRDLVAYCVNDVAILPYLRQSYLRRLNGSWRAKTILEAERRAFKARRRYGDPQHQRRPSLGPWEKPEDAGGYRLKKKLPIEKAVRPQGRWRGLSMGWRLIRDLYKKWKRWLV